ncbi:YeaC family protein [Thorsellia anophelis]|uniref:Uncharacterized protein n=1 Tax=Thorsellia anophelis DSM 18579 TaxID=1123402 RepID=A0A1I0C7L6_9GAMM|nr:DUF1315 family protein [Thorsellia anophelis]SET15450.1 hypothetical protein SAMN02583745_01503 [Thorsellia anophelis DSM 18579]
MSTTKINAPIDVMLASLTPEIYDRLLTAVETGKWADGIALTEEQKANTLQLVMLWQAKHNHNAEHMSINTEGEMVIESKQTLRKKFAGETINIITKDES